MTENRIGHRASLTRNGIKDRRKKTDDRRQNWASGIADEEWNQLKTEERRQKTKERRQTTENRIRLRALLTRYGINQREKKVEGT